MRHLAFQNHLKLFKLINNIKIGDYNEEHLNSVGNFMEYWILPNGHVNECAYGAVEKTGAEYERLTQENSI